MTEPTFPYITLTITHIQEEVPGVKTFTFDISEPDKLQYKAGQYITLVQDGPQGEVRRSYSITSSPLLNEPLSIGVKRIENGFFSRQLVDKAQVGDQFHSTGAGGLFTLPEDINYYKQIFFLAAGSGITPIYSLLKTVLHSNPELSVVLFYSNRSPEHAMFLQALQQLQTDFPDQLHTEFFFSNSPDLSKARLHKDLLVALLQNLSKAQFNQTLFYICGPTNYMRLTSFALRQQKVPASNIRKEIFNTAKALPSRLMPPDTDAHQVTLHIDGSSHTIKSKYPFSILQSARKAGIALPYSCEAGVCGNCIAKVVSGKVWMTNNEVLTEKDMEKGFTLTCVGYPVGGDVELQVR